MIYLIPFKKDEKTQYIKRRLWLLSNTLFKKRVTISVKIKTRYGFDVLQK
jgi:hypothetical protein